MSTDAEYHLGRARTERDIAYRSAHAVAADLHMRLSALHMHRALLIQAAIRGRPGNVHRFPHPQGAGERAAALPALQLVAMR